MEEIKEKFNQGYSIKYLAETYDKEEYEIHKIIGIIGSVRDSKYYRMLRDLSNKGYNNFSEFMIDVGVMKAKQYAKEFEEKIK